MTDALFLRVSPYSVNAAESSYLFKNLGVYIALIVWSVEFRYFACPQHSTQFYFNSNIQEA